MRYRLIMDGQFAGDMRVVDGKIVDRPELIVRAQIEDAIQRGKNFFLERGSAGELLTVWEWQRIATC